MISWKIKKQPSNHAKYQYQN